MALFGPFRILVDGNPLSRLRSRKAQWLIALLILRHGRSVEREWLAGTLWPEVEARRGFANLRPVLSELRKALGSIAVEQSNIESALNHYRASLTRFNDLGDREGITESLGGVAVALFARSDNEDAVRLWGAAHTLRETIGIPLASNERETYHRRIERAGTALGEAVFAVAWEEGRAWTLERAIAFAASR